MHKDQAIYIIKHRLVIEIEWCVCELGQVRMANMQIVPAYKNIVEAQYVEMMVPLYSYGCEKKVKKSLSTLKGN